MSLPNISFDFSATYTVSMPTTSTLSASKAPEPGYCRNREHRTKGSGDASIAHASHAMAK
jgi:hypothetical protein